MSRAKDGTRDDHDYTKDPKVQLPYTIVMRTKRWCLILKNKILYKCLAISEHGAHREALIWLKKKKKV